jgi:hydroxylamine reductase
MTTVETMYCYQCEQTAGGTGCTKMGVCGKDPDVAALQDLIVELCKRLGQYAHRLETADVHDEAAVDYIYRAFFHTVTNVDFDPQRLVEVIKEAESHRGRLVAKYREVVDDPQKLGWDEGTLPTDVEELVRMGREVGIDSRVTTLGEDVAGVQELLVYGLKGTAAYAHHAAELGQRDREVEAFFFEALDFLKRDEANQLEHLLPMVLKAGEVNLTVMGLLDAGHTDRYGHPEPTAVRVTPVAGKAIVVSGHDLLHLEQLLKQTQGTGIKIYTHGEMLPAHGYPELKKYDHLVGNYGGAWQDQGREFDAFPGAILMTTNCITPPKGSYKDRIFTSGPTAWPGVKHIAGPDDQLDFTPLIEAAQAQPGFAEDAPEKTITVGFARNAVVEAAPKVIELVKAGKLRHFFLVGGCDGAKSGRNYYTELAEQVPEDCVILTLACGKYRFNKMEFGTIDGLPRLLDCGQCNDAYSAIQIALALSEAFDCGVNDLPLSLVLSWYEQKAVCILLTLLHLGIKDMKLGPTLPAFVTPAVLNVLVEQFDIAPTTTPQADLADCLGE